MNLPKDSVGSGGAANVYQGTELWVRSGQSVRPPDVPEADGTTALHQASRRGALAAMDVLLAAGADVDRRALLSPLDNDGAAWAVHN